MPAMSVGTAQPASGEVAGRHLIIECFGSPAQLGAAALESLMHRAAAAGGATLLSCHMHRFGPGRGVTGVALLAESHITVHTWPERGYAAFDVFMCGGCNAEQAARVIAEAADDRVRIRSVDRPGTPPPDASTTATQAASPP